MAGQVEVEGSYDYIICGGGTSGCVVAGRLAEDADVSILIIEAGEHSDKIELTQMPCGSSRLVGNPETDWMIENQPDPKTNNRQLRLSRGKFLGGSSGCNGTLCIRGTKQDYDDWQMEGWNGDDFFGYMSKAETFHSKPWFQADDESHGSTGPFHTGPHDPAPISKLMIQSYESSGMSFDPDMFSKGTNPQGCGHAVRAVWKGSRSSGADYVTKEHQHKNVSVKSNTYVDKVILAQESGKLRATGVEFVTTNGARGFAKARKEVIVSGGAYCSPAILLRSGIGPKDEIQKSGISSQVDLPGVGKNLMDHVVLYIFYEVNKPNITNDYLMYHNPNAMPEAFKEWKTQRTGFLSSFPFGSFAYARLDDRLASTPEWRDADCLEGRDPMGLTPKQPNVEFWNTEAYGGPSHLYKNYPVDHKHAFTMVPCLFSQRSRGTVTLKSSNPLENPVVDHKYLEDPLDLVVLSEACRFANEIVMQGAGTKGLVQGSWPPNMTHHTYTKREDWEPYVRDNAQTCYHPAGTCKMGSEEDPFAVLDAQLRVRGVEHLRVADISVVPKLPNGHPMMPAIGIGEKAADLIKAAASTVQTV